MNGGIGGKWGVAMWPARSGRLRNGNPPGDLRMMARCGAKNWACAKFHETTES